MYDSTLPDTAEYARRYEHLIDIWGANLTTPAFITIRRADQVVKTFTPVLDNAQTNDDLGSTNQDVSAWNWTLAFRVIPARVKATQELVDEYEILDAAVGDAVGTDAVVRVRFYHAPKEGTVGDPRGAWEGLATVAIAPVDDGQTERWAVTLTGKGPATRLAGNPFVGRVPA
ncbi:hypothetical protein [Promicromonospora iranensis]|uniref:Uncharacterized protein n=1 Tax=Promicromonospora iranensis TaxID=1105144 RepID=A0ABU2CV40_9MICO|nr:hypothetical protein [Promicromonospora iranensis]MDR7385208.1 hypothetical protein [Promicromonospora iranensis]